MKWKIIWESVLEMEAILVKELLEGHAIPVQMLNQKDTAYIFLGEIRLLVPEYLEEDARKVLTINGYLTDLSVLN
ncbi:MAG: DUF2007 domain-containing protein [Saprospiraceae bacterium]|nr:DUF2007 domain-containing protein [Saprospiraceae bacterium]